LNSVVDRLLVSLLVLVGVAGTCNAHPLFEEDWTIKAVLTAPISQAYAQKNQEARIYFPGQWTYIDAGGETRKLDVSIRTRGHFRLLYCNRAPLQLNFKKSQVKGTMYAGQNKLKLVSPCENDARNQQYVILEFLAYKIFEILTDRSFRTRLIRLSYIDSDEKIEPWTVYTFVIEDDADMAKRLGLERLHVTAVKFAQLDQAQTALVELFEFLIGNNDYSVLKGPDGEECCHNTQPLAVDEAGLRLPVPYDFDMSGLVNAGYASPPHHLPIRDVRERYYQGLCQPDEILQAAIAQVRDKRAEITALFENSAELSDKTRSKSLDYIEDYYRIFDDPKRLKLEVHDRCRGRFLLDAMLKATRDPT
jgi:hypothetical protein